MAVREHRPAIGKGATRNRPFRVRRETACHDLNIDACSGCGGRSVPAPRGTRVAEQSRVTPTPSDKELAVMMGLQASGATENPSPSDRTFVVVISPADLSGDLGLTVLWRSDVQRVMVTTVEAAIEVARVRPATMFVLGGLDPDAAVAGLRRLRAEAATRNSALAALCSQSDLDREESLRAAGANVVLPTPVDPEVWDGRLDRLLRVPRRRSTRIPVRLTVWSRRSADPEPIEGV